MWPQEAELIFGPYTSLCMEDAGDMEKKGLKRFIKLRVSISTNRPSLEGLDLDDCSTVHDRAWHLPPPTVAPGTLHRCPTFVYTQFTLENLQDIDTARCVANVCMTMTMYHVLARPTPEAAPQAGIATPGDSMGTEPTSEGGDSWRL
jgi:hypothetical protein